VIPDTRTNRQQKKASDGERHQAPSLADRAQVARNQGTAMLWGGMGETMEIQPEWLAKAGVQNYEPTQRSFRCTAPHVLVALADIE
jgi:hypothetical protein